MTEPRTEGRSRSKGRLLVALVLVAALLFLAWSQVWTVVQLTDGALLEVAGQEQAPALSGLALAALALVGALTLAGRVMRRVIGVVAVLIGGLAVQQVFGPVLDPVAGTGSAVTAATGISGERSVRDAIATAEPTAWPVVALIGAVLLVVLGVAVLLLAGRWPVRVSRYRADRAKTTPETPGASAVDGWDALSRGDDPTSEAGPVEEAAGTADDGRGPGAADGDAPPR